MADRRMERTPANELQLALDPGALRRQPRRTHDAGEGLHVCPACHSELVYPTDWAPADAQRWSVALRCPECEWRGGGIYSQEAVDRFDEALDLGTHALLDDLGLLARANMEEQIDRFLDALWADRVLPEDF
jgi:hypothetical protein